MLELLLGGDNSAIASSILYANGFLICP